MADESPVVRKRVDESWKEQVDKEKTQSTGADAPAPAAAAAAADGSADQAAAPTTSGEAGPEAPIEARFDVFLSGLGMDALIGLGDLPHPATKKRSVNLVHAKYLIDLLGLIEDRTKGNLKPDESQLLGDLLYQLRMRYLNKTQSS